MFKHIQMRKAVLTLVACLVGALSVAACGSSSSSTTGSNAAASAGSSASSSAAATELAPYLSKPSTFPVTDKLEKVPKGATVAYMDCGTPVCALFYQLLQPAAKTMEVKLIRIQAGQQATTVSAAFDSVVTRKPAAVIVSSINVQLWASQLKQLQQAKIPVVTTGITGLSSYGVPAPQAAEGQSDLDGKLLADYVAVKFGPKSNVAFYDTPELTFTVLTGSAFKAQLAKVCPGCSVRTVPIAVATLGNSAPSTVVSDLQAHPATTAAVFGTDEVAIGLPAALKGAGITIKTLGNVPAPSNIQYVKEGEETATLGVDLPVLAWELLDQAAREIAGQKLTGMEAQGITDVQFLTQKQITFNPAMGWTGYPNFAQMFAKLWGVG